MSNLDTLKQELLTQKQLIEQMGGTVTTAYTNPSPSEITTGIQSLGSPDFSDATATASDVLSGKTFYAVDTTLKTGTLVALSQNIYDNILVYHDEDTSTLRSCTLSGMSKIRKYFVYQCPHPLSITFDTSALTEIGEYAFYGTNSTITNFSSCNNLMIVKNYAMYGVKGIDLSNLPTALNTLKDYALANTMYSNTDIVIPTTLTNVGAYALASQGSLKYLDSLTVNYTASTILGQAAFLNLVFDCDFTTSTYITTMNANVFCGGGFNNITITSNITRLSTACFGTNNFNSVGESNLETVTFLGTNPPRMDSNCLGEVTKRTNLKIYVPDAAYDDYCSVTGYFAGFSSQIYPVSERP